MVVSELMKLSAAVMDQSSQFLQKFFAENPVPEETIEYFSSTPWTKQILDDTRYRPIPTFSRILKDSGEDYFFAKTINTPATLPHYVTLISRNFVTAPVTKPNEPNKSVIPSHKQVTVVPEEPDCLFLIHFAEKGVDGHPGVVHGGVVCAILDETMGLMLMLHQNNTALSGPRDLLFTLNLSVTYRRQVPTPSNVMVRTWLVKREERKWYAKGQIVDKDGTVLSEADGLWLLTRGKL